MHVKISNGNTKLGNIRSVSLPAGETCRNDCDCKKKCYAMRMERLYPSVRKAYRHNLRLLNDDPDTYWREVEASIMKFNIVNEYLNCGGTIPENLHVVFSGWRGLVMNNPYSMPEAHVRYRDGTTTAGADAIECVGNCTECAMIDGGCWSLSNGCQVVFNEH